MKVQENFIKIASEQRSLFQISVNIDWFEMKEVVNYLEKFLVRKVSEDFRLLSIKKIF